MSFLYSQRAPASAPHVDPQPSYLAEYALFPFYDWIVQYYPKSWIPNKLTLFGVSCTLASSLLMLSSMPRDAAFDPPRAEWLPISWVVDTVPEVTPLHPTRIQPVLLGTAYMVLLYSICGILNLVYCVADNTDGRLARRDRKTSVIGEYLDHGLDCVTSLLSACIAFAVMGCSLSNMSISVCMIALVTVLSHALHFEQNIFIWGTRLATVDEAMIFFGICMWIPLLFPFLATEKAISAASLQGLPLLSSYPTLVQLVASLSYVECIYVFYNLAQAAAILSIASRRWSMLVRLPTLFAYINTFVLLAVIPGHSLKQTKQHTFPVLSKYTFSDTHFGPLMYPAVWMITAAATFSVIVHVNIASKCAKLTEIDVLPLASVIFVWFAFLTCPVGGMFLAVGAHVWQILANIRTIERKSRNAQR